MFYISLFAAAVVIIVEIYVLPTGFDGRGVTTYIVCLLAVLALLILAITAGTLQDDEKWLRRRQHWLGRTLLSILVVAIVASPVAYFAHASKAEFHAHPLSLAMRVEKAVPGKACTSSPVFVLLSDSHITDQRETLEHQSDGEGKLRRTFDLVRAVCPRLIVISGDLTDRGEATEWKLFEALHRQFRTRSESGHIRGITLLVPGNHDLQGSPYDSTGEVIDSSVGMVSDNYLLRVPYLARERSFLDAAREMGALAAIPRGDALAQDFSKAAGSALALAATAKTIFVGTGPTRNIGQPGEPHYHVSYPDGFAAAFEGAQSRFEDAFPLVYEDAQRGLGVILLNSSARLSAGASMGLGFLGAPQLGRLEELLSGYAASTKPIHSMVVVLHHGPVRRESDVWSWKDFERRVRNSDIWAHSFLAMDAGDSRHLVSILEKFAESRKDIRVVLAHGHRHANQPYLGRTEKGVIVLEAPSVIEEKAPGFWAAYRIHSDLAFKWITSSP